ncbi:MAG: Uma2 family endonuclease [Leptospiraceae bacterium]|nr:Uma2 family endonuclease [Leptospiraceae bacterium]
MIVLGEFPIHSSPLVKRYTLKEFEELPEPSDHSILELINGVLYVSPLPLPEHNHAAEKVDMFLRNLLLKGIIHGKVFRPRAGLKISEHTWLEPDLFYLGEENSKKFERSHPSTADLVVEIISPSTKEYDRKTKADTYAALCVRELWLIDIQEKTLEVRENSKGNTKWGRIVLYSHNEEVYSPVLEISFNTKDIL